MVVVLVVVVASSVTAAGVVRSVSVLLDSSDSSSLTRPKDFYIDAGENT